MTGPIPPPLTDLVGVPASEYGEHYRDHVLEQYKLYVNMADEISKRRHNASAFFLSINTAIIAFLGIARTTQNIHPAWYVVVGIAGLALSFAWQRTILSYRDLNTAKFTVIHEIEQLLPLKLYDAEWTLVKRGTDPKLYLPVSHLETKVPWVFFWLYIGLVGLIFFVPMK